MSQACGTIAAAIRKFAVDTWNCPVFAQRPNTASLAQSIGEIPFLERIGTYLARG